MRSESLLIQSLLLRVRRNLMKPSQCSVALNFKLRINLQIDICTYKLETLKYRIKSKLKQL